MIGWRPVALVLLLAVPAAAQTPAPPAGPCEDQLRETRVNLQITTLGQVRERAEAAREIAQLMKRVEALQADLAAMQKALEALKPKPPVAPVPK